MNPLAAIFLDDARPIHERYQILAAYLGLRQPVLKTDLWNELNTQWPIHADLYVEIDQEMVNHARQKGLNATRGSIEKLPISDRTISSILDFSTLDHIPEPLPAIKEYYRVLKNNVRTRCLLISWVGNKASHQMPNWDGLQHYFDETMLIEKIIRAGFIIRWHEKFEGLGDETSTLKCFYLEKPGFFRKFKRNLINLIPFSKNTEIPDTLLKIKPFALLQPAQIAQYPSSNIEHRVPPDSNKFCFVANNTDPQIIFMNLNLPKTAFLLQFEIESSTDNVLQIFYLQQGTTDFCEEFSTTKRIFPGSNQIRIFIPETKTENILRLDPANSPGYYCMGRIGIFSIHQKNLHE